MISASDDHRAYPTHRRGEGYNGGDVQTKPHARGRRRDPTTSSKDQLGGNGADGVNFIINSHNVVPQKSA